jgi:RNA polymerase sigma-70 factor (ECF subfamily)
MSQPKRDFESAVHAVYAPLVRSASVLCWSDVDVEDVVQETILRALRSYGSFNGSSSFLTWCYAILTRVASAANQRRSRQIPADYAAGRNKALPPVDSRLVEDDEARVLVDAIRSLPPRQREVITLHFLQELSYADIAQALGVAVGTVKATIYSAKSALRVAFANNAAESRRT